MNQSPFLKRPDYVVCTCMGVMYSELCEAIKEGLTTFEQLSDKFMVGTGCNSCVSEIEEIIKEETDTKHSSSK